MLASAVHASHPPEVSAAPTSATADLIQRAADLGMTSRPLAPGRWWTHTASIQDSFWAFDTFRGTYYRLPATRRHVGPRDAIYVEDGVPVPDEAVRELAEALEDVVIPTLRRSYGPRLGRELGGEADVLVLLLDIHDPHYYGAEEATYLAGYFDPANEFSQAELDELGTGQRSNERHMIYLDIAPPTKPRGAVLQQTLAHEFTHLIHWGYDPDEEAWLSEGFSELGVYLCGFSHPMSHVLEFLSAPEISLVTWSGAPRDYGKVYLFALYLYEQLAAPDGAWLRGWFRNPANGLTSVAAALPTDRPLPAMFRDYGLALFADMPNLEHGRFAFRSLELSALDAPDAIHAVAHEHGRAGFGIAELEIAPWTVRADRMVIPPKATLIGLRPRRPICAGAIWPLRLAAEGSAPSFGVPCLAAEESTSWVISPEESADPTAAVLIVAANASAEATSLSLTAIPAQAGIHGTPGWRSRTALLPLAVRR